MFPSKTSSIFSFSGETFFWASLGFPMALMSCTDLLTAILDRAGTATFLRGAVSWAFEAREILDISNLENDFANLRNDFESNERNFMTSIDWLLRSKTSSSWSDCDWCEKHSKLLEWNQFKQFHIELSKCGLQSRSIREKKRLSNWSKTIPEITLNWFQIEIVSKIHLIENSTEKFVRQRLKLCTINNRKFGSFDPLPFNYYTAWKHLEQETFLEWKNESFVASEPSRKLRTRRPIKFDWMTLCVLTGRLTS